MLERLLITGAAGRVARLLVPHISRVARSIRLSDIKRPKAVPDEAEFIQCDLKNFDAVSALMEGCDGVIHLGGIAEEDSFHRILDANIEGVYNLYEAARLSGKPRILFASTNHVVGYYRQDQYLNNSALPRPDTWYAVSKVFGEAVGELYFRKFGVETAIVRIGSCFDKPVDRRMLATWFSPADFGRLVERIFEVHRLGCPIIYGVSDNDGVWWDNSAVSYIGWRPQDSSRQFSEMFHTEKLSAEDAHAYFQGGRFTEVSIIGDET